MNNTLAYLNDAARAARNEPTPEHLRDRNEWIAQAKDSGFSTWAIANTAQVTESTVRAAVRKVRAEKAVSA